MCTPDGCYENLKIKPFHGSKFKLKQLSMRYVGGDPRSEEFWAPIGKRLDGRKEALISKGGRFTLVQSVLLSILRLRN